MEHRRKQILKKGCEYDIQKYCKKFYCYLKKPGVSASIKKALNKRYRQELKRELNDYET